VLAPLWRRLKAQLFGHREQEAYEDAPVSMSFLGLEDQAAIPEPAPKRQVISRAAPVLPMRETPPQPRPEVSREEIAPPQPVYQGSAIQEEPVILSEPVALPEAVQEVTMPEAVAKPPVFTQEESVQEESVQQESPAIKEAVAPMRPVYHEAVEALPRIRDSKPSAPSAEEDTRSDLRAEWHEKFEPQAAVAAQSSPLLPEAVPAMPVTQPADRKAPVLVRAAMRMEEMRARASLRFKEWWVRPRSDSKQPARDYVWRQALPAAAGLALAFLIGWTVALHSGSNQPATTSSPGIAHSATGGFTVGPDAPAASGGYTVGPQANSSAPSPAVKPPVTARPLANNKPSPRHGRAIRQDIAEDDVVVHHYTAKPKAPEVHRASLKKYSDLN